MKTLTSFWVSLWTNHSGQRQAHRAAGACPPAVAEREITCAGAGGRGSTAGTTGLFSEAESEGQWVWARQWKPSVQAYESLNIRASDLFSVASSTVYLSSTMYCQIVADFENRFDNMADWWGGILQCKPPVSKRSNWQQTLSLPCWQKEGTKSRKKMTAQRGTRKEWFGLVHSLLAWTGRSQDPRERASGRRLLWVHPPFRSCGLPSTGWGQGGCFGHELGYNRALFPNMVILSCPFSFYSQRRSPVTPGEGASWGFQIFLSTALKLFLPELPPYQALLRTSSIAVSLTSCCAGPFLKNTYIYLKLIYI